VICQQHSLLAYVTCCGILFTLVIELLSSLKSLNFNVQDNIVTALLQCFVVKRFKYFELPE